MASERTDAPSDDPEAAAALEDATCWGPLLIDHAAHEIRVDECAVALTLREYELLCFLVMNPRRVYSRQALVAVLWGDQRDVGTRAIDGHVRCVRAKLGPDLRGWIRTVRGVGYAFSPVEAVGRLSIAGAGASRQPSPSGLSG